MADDFTWDDRALFNAVKKGAQQGVRAAAKHARNALKTELSGPVGSAPGQPPGHAATPPTDLRKSIRYKVRTNAHRVDAQIGALADKDGGQAAAQGARLAGGFVGRDRAGRVFSQAPRPWLRPVVEREKKTMAGLIAEGLRGDVAGGSDEG